MEIKGSISNSNNNKWVNFLGNNNLNSFMVINVDITNKINKDITNNIINDLELH